MTRRPRVWKFGDDVNTDLIIAGKHLDNYDPAHLASHAMEGANRDFAVGVRKGDIIVAGHNFGCGSSREQAVVALKHSGIQAIVACSFARIFYRNAINLGLPVFTSSRGAETFKDGDSASVTDDLAHVLADDGRSVALDPVPAHVRDILDAGGLIPFIRNKLKGNPGENVKSRPTDEPRDVGPSR